MAMAMAIAPKPSCWDELPDEILLQIISYLLPIDIARLQLVSRKLQKIGLDDDLWKRHCFHDSPWYEILKRQRLRNQNYDKLCKSLDLPDANPTADADSLPNSVPSAADEQRLQKWQQMQDMANWDPGFPDERISWYDEYIQRNGPVSVSWLETPRIRDRGMEAIIEARGMALYNPNDGCAGDGTLMAVSPLDDGSVCLWDIRGTQGREGGIIGRSRPDILFIDGPSGQNTRRSKRIDTGVTECVSVNHQTNRAFFAVQSHLIEVDLDRLDVVSRVSFEWSITTLSQVNDGLPLTVGTSLGIHLHDFRERSSVSKDMSEHLDWDESDIYKSIFDPRPLPPYASLSQPTPISILHLPQPGSHSLVSDDIYVSGRFSNILHYDRRKFPAIVGSIYSGGLIKSLAAIPYPSSPLNNELRRRGELSMEQVERLKTEDQGVTMVAGGTYKSIGSLETYSLDPMTLSNDQAAQNNGTTKNRQTAASSTILSVATQGTKIAFSDGSGMINWFERDGFTECRRHRIGRCDGNGSTEERSMFVSSRSRGGGELARKIVSTGSTVSQDRPNSDNLLFWTGERLGLISFTNEPLYQASDFNNANQDEVMEDEERQVYSERMLDALEGQADEMKLMARFGHGP